jgi:ParB-like nuclease domain
MATTVHEAGRRIALDEIRVPENVRSLDDSHVQALAGSIKLQGMLVPLVVRDDGDGFELVAGFHRIAAARSLGLAAVDQLRAIGTVAPELLDAVIAYLDDGNAWAAERLTREPGWVLDAALTHAGNSKVFAAYLHNASAHEIAELRLGKKTEHLYAQAEKLHKQLDRYAYGPPQVHFTDTDVDQARAAGVLIEFERHAARGMTLVMPRRWLCRMVRCR